MEKYLITGGLGYIGRNLTSRLLELGNHVTILDKTIPSECVYSSANCEIIKGNILNYPLIKDLLKGVDGVFHLASLSSPKYANSNILESHNTNVLGQLTLIKAIKDYSIHKIIPFVYLSSSSVYGDNACMPVRENDFLRPITPFAADRLSCENHARSVFLSNGIPSVGFRIFNLYGPVEDAKDTQENVISQFIYQIKNKLPLTVFGDGEQLRDFIFISDVVEFLIRGIKYTTNTADIFNLCTGNGISINNLAKNLITLSGSSSCIEYKPRRSNEILQSVGDTKRVYSHLHYSAKMPLADGLKQSLNNSSDIFIDTANKYVDFQTQMIGSY